MRALQSADVILIDDLVAPAILDFARREAKKMMVGKTGFAPSCKQDEINALMVSLAKAGRRVVRLKGGDPMIFGRAGEEIAACRKAGIPVEVVPGISAAQGAASRLGVSLTHRKLARRMQYVTGARRRRQASRRHRLGERCRSRRPPPWSTCRSARWPSWPPPRRRAGLPPDTPAIAVVAATRPEQEVIAGTIADIAARLEAAAPERPVLVMIGRALAQAAQDQQILTSTPALPPRSPASSASSRPR